MIQGTLTNNRTGIFGEATYDLSNWEKILSQNLKGGGYAPLLICQGGAMVLPPPSVSASGSYHVVIKKTIKSCWIFLVN